MSKSFLHLVVTLTLLLIPCQFYAQQPKYLGKTYPIIFGKREDGLPKTIKVHGLITEVSPHHISCGVMATAGTMKVELISKIKGYDYDSVFLVIPCWSGIIDNSYLDKSVNITVNKFYEIGKPCYYESVLNRIDSQGIPFYCAKSIKSIKNIKNE